MDNLVLIRVAASYDRELRGAVLREVHEDSSQRYRLVFALQDRPRSIAVSIEPATPWTGRPVPWSRLAQQKRGPFAAVLTRSLRGRILGGVVKPPADRRLSFRFTDGQVLEVALAPHRSNLILLDPDLRVVIAARRPRRQRSSLQPGIAYTAEPLPPGREDPFSMQPEEITQILRSGANVETPAYELLRRRFAGIGREAGESMVREAREANRELGLVVHERLARVVRGESVPTIEAADEPRTLAERGVLDESSIRIHPWQPPWPPDDGVRRISHTDPAETAGLYHGAIQLSSDLRGKAAALETILDREIVRLASVQVKVAADLASFQDPARFRRWGEALLAGLKQAERAGEHVLVPDPYDPEGRTLPVPVEPGERLTSAAERHFAGHRRARRGLERARERAGRVADRKHRLEEIRDRQADQGAPASDALVQAMQGEGIPVGLVRAPGVPGRAAATEPRLEGVRMFLSRDGLTVLVGKSGRDNQRLTFKLASPEDFWLHAVGVPGAHVIVRNEGRSQTPPEQTLVEAAETAAWYSEAREHNAVDVQWTRRKYVRKLRGAPPGTVRVKRSETLRVRPRLAAALETAS